MSAVDSSSYSTTDLTAIMKRTATELQRMEPACKAKTEDSRGQTRGWYGRLAVCFAGTEEDRASRFLY